MVVVLCDSGGELNYQNQKLEEVDVHILRMLWVEGETCMQLHVIFDTCPEMKIRAKSPPPPLSSLASPVERRARVVPGNEICYGNFPEVSGDGEVIQNPESPVDRNECRSSWI